MEYLNVGKIVNTFGIKGEIKIYPAHDYFEELDHLVIQEKSYWIEKMRFQKPLYVVKLQGIDDISVAETLKGVEVFVEKDEIPALPENTYYIEDILGFEVITDEGKVLGKLDDVFNTGANDIYQVGEILLPATKEVILKVDFEKKQILVHLLKGMI